MGYDNTESSLTSLGIGNEDVDFTDVEREFIEDLIKRQKEQGKLDADVLQKIVEQIDKMKDERSALISSKENNEIALLLGSLQELVKELKT